MTRFWIRVNARLADDVDVRAFAKAILPRASVRAGVAQACGYLVILWGHVIDEQEDGDVSSRDDDTLEEWARWDGKRGVFAKAFRAAFTIDGKIQQWDEYQGTLIIRRERDRDRKRTGKPKDSAPNSSGIPAEVHTHSSGNGNGNGQALVSVPNGTERQEPTPGLALAPEGAAPAVANDGNYLDSMAAQEALMRRGVHSDQIAAAPRGNLTDHNADLEFRQTQYDAELELHATAWMQEHQDETAEIGAAIRVERGYPAEKSPSALTAPQRGILRGLVFEEVRRRNEWPSLDAWDGAEFKTAVSA